MRSKNCSSFFFKKILLESSLSFCYLIFLFFDCKYHLHLLLFSLIVMAFPACTCELVHTAISSYVVGSKLQGYGTRPKGGMGRLELILGFRGCRREMDMEADNTI